MFYTFDKNTVQLLRLVCKIYPAFVTLLSKSFILVSCYYQEFTGNIDRSTVVENRLSKPVVALCIRLIPLTWTAFPCLRMEVIGCNFNASGVVQFYEGMVYDCHIRFCLVI